VSALIYESGDHLPIKALAREVCLYEKCDGKWHMAFLSPWQIQRQLVDIELAYPVLEVNRQGPKEALPNTG
jgi:hypothetical protein